MSEGSMSDEQVAREIADSVAGYIAETRRTELADDIATALRTQAAADKATIERLTAERDEARQEGIRAAFDYILCSTANNYSFKPEEQAQRERENSWAESMAEDMLTDLAPGVLTQWKDLGVAMRRAEAAWNRRANDAALTTAERRGMERAVKAVEQLFIDPGDTILDGDTLDAACDAIRALAQGGGQ